MNMKDEKRENTFENAEKQHKRFVTVFKTNKIHYLQQGWFAQ